jgi:hypothetical protein
MGKRYTLDFETNDLFLKQFLNMRGNNGKIDAEGLNKILTAYEHVSPMQVGLHTSGDNISSLYTQHLELLNIKSTIPEHRRVGNVFQRDPYTKSDLVAYLSTKESKVAGKPKKIEDYWSKIGSGKLAKEDRTMYVKDDFYLSKFSEQHFSGINAQESIAAIVSKGRRIEFQEETMETFIKSTASPVNGVYKNIHSIMTDLLDGASATNPAKLEAWNGMFDFYASLSMLNKGGHFQLLERAKEAFNAKHLLVESMEDSWQKVAYSLSKEHSSLFKNLITNNSPETVFALGDWNRKVKNFEEFRYSIMPWNQDYLGKNVFGWHKDIVEQIHFAGPDVDLSRTIKNTSDEIISRSIQKARDAGFNKVSSMEDIWKLPGENKFITEAFDEIINAMGHNTNTKKVTAEKIVETLRKTVDEVHFYQTKGQGSRLSASASGGGGGKILSNIFGGDIGGGAWKRLGRYSGLGLGVALLVGSTYRSDKEEKRAGRFNFDISTKGATRISAIDRSDEDPTRNGPHINAKPFTNLVFPLLTAAGAVTAIGAGAARRMPSRLGYEYRKPATKAGYASELYKTFRHGVNVTEEVAPVTRVFNVSSFLNSTFGTRNLTQTYKMGTNVIDHTTIKGRAYQFNTIQDGKIINATDTKLANLDRFIESIMQSNPEHADEIRELLRPSKVAGQAGNINKRVVRIGHSGSGFNKKTVLNVIDMSDRVLDHGNKIQSQRAFELDLVTSVAKMRRQISNGDKLVDILAYAVGRSNEIFQGRHNRVDFETYLGFQRQPRVAARYPWLNKLYVAGERIRYHLDLNAKGVGQGRDLYRGGITSSMINKDATIHIQRFSGEKALSLPGLKAGLKYTNDSINAMFLHSIDNFLEAPFELIGFDANKIEASARRMIGSNSLTKNIAGKGLSLINKPHFGLGYTSMKYGLPEYMLKFALKRALPAYLAINLFDVFDKGAGVLATGNSESPGLMRGGANFAFQSAALAYSKVSDMTGMTDWAKWQNSVAPGSTGLGVLAPGMSALAMYKLGDIIYKRGPSPIRDWAKAALDPKRSGVGGRAQDFIRDNIARNKWVQKAIAGEGFLEGASKAKLNNAQKIFNYMIKNPKMATFLTASLPMLPFLPGFLGSDKSYGERRAEFKGDKEVAIRKHRGWMLSTSPFSGDKALQYRQHASYLMSRDWEASGGVIYPSFKDRALNRLTFGLYKPNILEEYHAAAQPVYRTSSSFENVPFIGPVLAAMSNRILGGREYHSVGENTLEGAGGAVPAIGSAVISKGGKIDGQSIAIDDSGQYDYGGDLGHLAQKWLSQTTDLAGFRGFMLRTAVQQATGQSQPNEFTPYLETSSKLYNQSHKLWGYSAGDISFVAGEFLRRIYQNPNHDGWMVNDIPNELMGASWIPHNDKFRDFTRGTTFDKIPMGWLYGSRKGWEYLHPEIEGQDLNEYSDPIRLEILQQIAPYSPQFRSTANRVMDQAMSGQLTPGEEQRYYETLDNVREIKTQIWAHANEGSTSVAMLDLEGTVEQVEASTGRVKIRGYNDSFRIAGVSFVEADIRKRLLDSRQYETSSQLEFDMREIKQRMNYILSERLSVGNKIDFQVAAPENFPTNEISINGLTEELLKAGAPMANTGPIASHNIAADRAGAGSRGLASLWSNLTDESTYFNKKLISERDYISQYKGEQVFSRQVRLWTKPIEHLLKPMIAQTLHRFGVEKTPSFTEERRAQQQYWDTIKYVKYKMLENQALRDGDAESARNYKNIWRKTMIGANPTDANPRDEMMALPKNERAYFNFIANEVDPKRRQEIFRHLPDASKRIYRSIWAKKQAEAAGDLEALARLEESEGWEITDEEKELYYKQTDGKVAIGDWIRAQVVADYSQYRAIPDASWAGWAPNVDLENVQLLSLRDEGEQIQDYGFFEQKLREAVYDDVAFDSAMYINNLSQTPSNFYGSVIPSLLSEEGMVALPTTSPNTNSHITIETNDYDKRLKKSNDKYLAQLSDEYV